MLITRGATARSYAVDWDRLARWYDLQLGLERPALAAAADLLAVGPQDVVLDVGTGTGGFLRELAARPGRPRVALGIDASPRMLARVPALPRGWQLLPGEAGALRLEDASVDAASCAYLLHLLAPAGRAAVLAELRRVLRPGGRLVTVTPAPPRSRLGAVYPVIVETLAAFAPGAFIGLRPLDPEEALRASGFRPRAGTYVTRGYPSICVLSLAP